MDMPKTKTPLMRRAKHGLRTTCLSFVFCGVMAVSAWAGERVALLIGNGQYARIPALSNPTNDVKALDAKLKSLGFKTIVALDSDFTAMRKAAGEFARKANGAEAAIVFYAGHGIQIAGENYLLPVDASLEAESDVAFQTMAVSQLIRTLRGADVGILMLDACRDNPFATKLSQSMKTRGLFGVSRGLARVEKSDGLVVVYATQANAVAEDGKPGNSPFTASLLKYVGQPKLEIGRMFRRVAADVYKQTSGRQRPEITISLLKDFYLGPEHAPEAAPTPQAGLPQAQTKQNVQKPTGIDARQYWEIIKDSNDLALLKKFIRLYGTSGPHGQQAKEKLVALSPADAAALATRPIVPQPGSGPNALRRVNDCDLQVALSYDEARKEGVPPRSYASIDSAQAIAACQRALEQAPGNGRYLAYLGVAYDRGDKFKEARGFFRQSAATGNALGLLQLAYANETGLGGKLDFARARTLYQQAWEKGNSQAAVRLGVMYASGMGSPADEAEARVWYSRAIEKGNEVGYVALARMIIDNPKHKDLMPKALSFLERAAEQNNSEALTLIGRYWSRGWGGKVDFAQARAALDKAVALDDAEAYNEIGLMHEKGRGLAKDFKQARIWYTKSALKGDAVGALNLGELYRHGRGMRKPDYVQARRWFKISADRNDLDGAIRYAILLDEGRGGPKKINEAVEYLMRGIKGEKSQLRATFIKEFKYWSRAFRMQVQRRLKDEGFYKGRIDGQGGPATRRALNAYGQAGQ